MESAVGQPFVVVDGVSVEATAAAVWRRLAELRTPPERQVALWRDLYRQLPTAEWGEVCMAEAERVQQLLERERRLAPSPSGTHRKEMPQAGHFVWLGADRGVRVEHLRDGILRLAAAGLIDSSREQQEALRRGLGVAVNDDERHHEAPPVRWLGPTDMLWLVVEGLWEMGLITCVGGRQYKWRTACAVFRRADGSAYGLTLKNSRCTNPAKVAVIEKALLGELRFVAG